MEAVIPNPKEMPCIMKNEAVNIFVLLKQDFAGAARFAVTYKDSATKETHRAEMLLEEKATVYPYVEKMAQHRKLTLLCDAIRNKTRVASDALLG